MHNYKKKSLIPLQLFNFYDNQVFDSFEKIISSSSPHNKDPQKYLNKVIVKFYNQHLLIQLLNIFPYIAFTDFQKVKLIQKSDLNSIYNQNKLLGALNLRINKNEINNQLIEIEKIQDAKIDRNGFFTEIFICYYKYFFIQLIESINWITHKVDSSRELNIKFNLSELLDRYTKNKINLNTIGFDDYDRLIQYDEKKLFLNSLGFNKNFEKQIFKELQIYNKNSKLALHLYDIIHYNIILPEHIEPSYRNKLLRPLFREIVCKICYPRVFNSYYLQDDLNRKYRKFLTTYKKKLK